MVQFHGSIRHHQGSPIYRYKKISVPSFCTAHHIMLHCHHIFHRSIHQSLPPGNNPVRMHVRFPLNYQPQKVEVANICLNLWDVSFPYSLAAAFAFSCRLSTPIVVLALQWRRRSKHDEDHCAFFSCHWRLIVRVMLGSIQMFVRGVVVNIPIMGICLAFQIEIYSLFVWWPH